MGKSKVVLWSLLVLSILGNLYLYTKNESQTIEVAEQPDSTKYPLLAKRIYLADKNDFLLNFQSLRKSVNAYIEQHPEEKIHYYFEYLPSGMSIGINERNQFPAGSLGKIPVVMAIYKKIEKGDFKETDRIKLKDSDKDQEFGDFWKQPVGTEITIEDAVKKTLMQSDNTTFRMLQTPLTDTKLLEAYETTDISFVEVDGKPRPYVSPKSNASAFKALFLSVYLNQENSQKLLEYMSETSFHDGLTKYISPNVKVSHKIGVASFVGVPSSSDCGIFYLPQRPYFLCVMIQGDRTVALEHIANLSKLTNNYVSSTK